MFPSYFASCIPFPSLYASWSRSFIMVPISSCIGLALNDRSVLNCGFHELMQAKSHVYVVTKAFNHPSSSPSSLAYNLKLSTQKKVWVMILFLFCICFQVSSVQWEICEIQKKKKKSRSEERIMSEYNTIWQVDIFRCFNMIWMRERKVWLARWQWQ